MTEGVEDAFMSEDFVRERKLYPRFVNCHSRKPAFSSSAAARLSNDAGALNVAFTAHDPIGG